MSEPAAFRSLLFVPGDRPDMIAKVGRSAPDGVVLDLEDAVAVGSKDAARQAVVDALSSLEVPAGTLVLVRVNPAGSPWHADDVAATAGTRADGIVLPKTESAAQLTALRDALAGHRRPDGVVVAGLETARGVADARPILAAGVGAGVVAAYFGAEDFVADVGGRRTPEGREVLYARSQVLLAARLAGVGAIDQAVVDIGDADRFTADAEAGRAIGYTGKICVHPRQVELSHRVFTPTAGEVAHAGAVLAAVESGGVAVVDGEMVDEVHVRMARRVLAQAQVEKS